MPQQSYDIYSQNGKLSNAKIVPVLYWDSEQEYLAVSTPNGIDFTQTPGLTAYKVVLNDKAEAPAKAKVLSLRAESGSVLKLVELEKAGAGDCVLVKADEPGKTYELVIDESAENLTDNLLKAAADEDIEISGTEGENTNFVFNGSEFVVVEGSEDVAWGTGYLQIPTEEVPEGTKGITMDGTPSGINGITNAENGKAIIYDLQGRKLNTPHRGINIVNGKKMVVK